MLARATATKGAGGAMGLGDVVRNWEMGRA